MKKAGSRSLLAVSAAVFGLLFTLAFSGSMWNTMLPQIQDTYRASLAQVGVFNAAVSVGMLLSALVAGAAGGRLSNRTVMLALYPVYILLLFAAGSLPSFWLLVLVAVLLGTCSGAIMLTGNVLIAKLYPTRSTRALNLLHTLWGVGQCLAPGLVTVSFHRGLPWNWDFQLCGWLLIPLGVLFFWLLLRRGSAPFFPPAARRGPQPRADGPRFRLLASPLMAALCTGLFLQANFQNSLMSWLPLFLADYHQADATVMGLAAALLWVGITVGRILYSAFLQRLSLTRYLKFCSLAAGLLTIAALAVGKGWLWLFVTPVLGLLISAIYPNGVALTCECFPQCPEQANAAAAFTSNAGCMLMSAVIGLLADSVSFPFAMALPALLYLPAWGCFHFVQKRRAPPLPKGESVC